MVRVAVGLICVRITCHLSLQLQLKKRRGEVSTTFAVVGNDDSSHFPNQITCLLAFSGRFEFELHTGIRRVFEKLRLTPHPN